jgi:cysteinyl-tRNA synthetase
MREEARADRRWEDADALRAQIREAGYEIEDTRYGPRLRRAT